MQQLALALKPGGRVAIWSACPDAVIERRLSKGGITMNDRFNRADSDGLWSRSQFESNIQGMNNHERQ
jgi:hypothetical protein